VNVAAHQDAMIVGGTEAISTAESFATYNGKEIINLGKQTTEWLVDPKTVLSEGLSVAEEKGENTMLTEEQVKELQDELKATKEANETLVSEKEVLTSENEQLKTDVEELTTAKEAAEKTLADKEAELVTTQENLTAKENEVAELTATNETLVAEKSELETSLNEEKEARTHAVEENAKLSTDMHKMVAERVVDLRISLGKESNREEAITAYAGRSAESLNDSLADLLKEATAAPKQVRQAGHVANPALGTDGTGITESKSTLTAEEVMLNLFRGPGAKK